LAFVLLTIAIPEPAHQLEYVEIRDKVERPLWVAVFVPQTAHRTPAPAAVICQPINNGPDSVRPLAMELTQSGFVVLAFDWRGRSPDQNRQALRTNLHGILLKDGLAAVNYLRARPDVDPQRIVIAGHSVGGNMAIDVALNDPAILATACIGMETEVPSGQPRNLLWAAGLYDEFRSPLAMRAAFEASAGTFVSSDKSFVGEFARGTARGIALSPTADHLTELLERRMQQEVVRWFCLATNMDSQPRRFWAEGRARAYTAAWLMAFAAALVIARALFPVWSPAFRRSSWLRAIPAAGLLVVFALSTFGRHFPFLAADVVNWTLWCVPLATFACSCSREDWSNRVRKVSRIALLVWATFLLTLLVNRIVYLVLHPTLLIYFPEFAVGHFLTMVYAYLIVYPRQLTFATCVPGTLAIHYWVYAILAIELIKPGVLLQTITALLVRLTKRPAVEARAMAPSRGIRKTSPYAIIMFLVLVAALGAVLWLRFLQGFVTPDSLKEAGGFVLRFGVAPVLIFVLLTQLARRRSTTREKTRPPDIT
jgi:hypothetical protein